MNPGTGGADALSYDHPHRQLRLGTVRRPPRGVPKAEFAKRDFYDVWLPALSLSAELMELGQQARDARDRAQFTKAELV